MEINNVLVFKKKIQLIKKDKNIFSYTLGVKDIGGGMHNKFILYV